MQITCIAFSLLKSSDNHMLLTNINYLPAPSSITGTVNTSTETLTPFLDHPAYLGPLSFGSPDAFQHVHICACTHMQHLPTSIQGNTFFSFI